MTELGIDNGAGMRYYTDMKNTKATAEVTSRKQPSPKQSPFSSRIRFNWGFHDGANHGRMDGFFANGVTVETHFDRAYAAGFTAGVVVRQITGEHPESSEQAWMHYMAKNDVSTLIGTRRTTP